MAQKQNWQQINFRPPKGFPRSFLPDSFNLADWKAYAPYAQDLLSRNIINAGDLKHWLRDYMEFINVIWEEEARIYVTMTCDTRNKKAGKKYMDFAREVKPQLDRFENEARKKVHESPYTCSLSPKQYGRWLHSLTKRMALFCEKNLSLNTGIQQDTQAYQKVGASMMVEWKGKKRTVVQMNTILQNTDREVREKAWRLTWQCYINNRPRLNRIFQKLFNQRKTLAKNLGLPNYEEYAFRKFDRTDYTVKDCLQFHDTIEQVVVPRYRQILEWKREQLGVKTLRPWDMACDPQKRAMEKPFSGIGELRSKIRSIFKKMDPDFHSFFTVLEKQQLLDLDNRPGKRPGGYQIILDEIRLPFVFMNAAGSSQDILTLLHESGHAFHLFFCRQQALYYNREAPLEFCEFASMTMERLGMEYFDTIFPPTQRAREIVRADEDIFRLLIWICIIDSFQHWMYTHPSHTAADRNRKWVSIMDRFQAGLDWSGLSNYRKTAWHRQIHIFNQPFYYIEYGIAQIGALQMWLKFKQNRSHALQTYKRALSCGGTLGLAGLFKKAGVGLDFTPETIEPLVSAVFDEWNEYKER